MCNAKDQLIWGFGLAMENTEGGAILDLQQDSEKCCLGKVTDTSPLLLPFSSSLFLQTFVLLMKK